MLRPETETEQRQWNEQGRDERGGLLQQGLPFGIAFAAGFLLGRRRAGGDSTEQSEEGEIRARATDTATRTDTATDTGTGSEAPQRTTPEETEQPSSMGSVSGEEQRQREREATRPAGTGVEGGQPAGSEAAEIDEEVAGLSAPTTRGMPTFGLGTYDMDEYDECFESVRMALQMGYRHVDTAEGYDNETAVGDAITAADVARGDLFVATKVSPDDLDYDRVLTSAEESLERLGLDYVDLLYVHWPTGEYEATDTLDAFAELRREGMIEEIGVSNFTVDLLEEAVEVSEEPVFANQVEMHPLLAQTELQQFCAQDDVDVELVAYSPIARGDVTEVDELQEVAQKHDATPVQVSLAWLREKEVTAIPKATSRDHLRENWLSLDVELDDEDVAKIDDIDETERLVNPDRAPWNQ
jgi:2,5-diketo-D-gluconate reductase B